MSTPHYKTARRISAPTFLRSKLLMLEERQRLERHWSPAAVGMPAFAERAARLPEKVRAQVLRQYDGALDLHRRLAEIEFREAGMPAEVLHSPKGQELLEKHVRLRLRNAIDAGVHGNPSPDLSAAHLDLKSDHLLFGGRLVHRVVAGAFVTYGEGDRAKTRDFLNHGLPIGKTGIDYSHIRNAIDALLRGLERGAGTDVRQWEIVLWLCALEVEAAWGLWADLGGRPGQNGSGAKAQAALISLIDSGDFHEAFNVHLEEAARREIPDVGPLIEQQIKRLRKAAA